MPIDRELIARVRRLDEYDLRRLLMFAAGVLAARTGEPANPPEPRPDHRASSRPTYRRQLVRCGKGSCTRCPHGPYWYAYWREDGRLRSRYVGKEPPSDA